MKIRHALVVLVLLVSGFGIFGPGVGPATAQEESVPTAALVEGTCRAPGNTVAELNELRVRDEGDVLASFTTVDASLDDILGSEHAVVLTDGGDVVACGDRFGTGGDVYVAVPATTHVGWGGIAWFHARNSGTQITLFVAQGLGGAGVAPGEPTAEPTEEPPLPPGDDDNETPVPPGDDDSLTPVPPGDDDNGTPIARATVTPRTNSTRTTVEGDSYTSPSYGYTLTYDPAVWDKTREVSNPTESGPLDILGLESRNDLVTLVGETGTEGFDALKLCQVRVDQYSSDPGVSGLTVKEPVDGDANHATVQFEYTYTADDGKTYDWSTWIDCYNAPDNSVLLSFYFSALREFAEQEVQTRDDLLAGLTFPGQ
ncbi:MAG TPA: hypothetical protein VKB09_03155 [Thermomicrobiales bacterium]|nr:hypothetical protein [Thermomicrobiales bacterium]